MAQGKFKLQEVRENLAFAEDFLDVEAQIPLWQRQATPRRKSRCLLAVLDPLLQQNTLAGIGKSGLLQEVFGLPGKWGQATARVNQGHAEATCPISLIKPGLIIIIGLMT